MSTALAETAIGDHLRDGRTSELRRPLPRWGWSALAPLLVLAGGLGLYVLSYRYYHVFPPVMSDGEGYYAYLPAYFLQHDPSFNSVLHNDILPRYAAVGHQPPSQFGFSLQPTGAWLDKYGVGVAVLQSPLFLAGHLLALAIGAPANGYSAPEEYAVGLGSLFSVVLGLFALRAVLRRWFSDSAVAVTLVAIAAGTGAMAYTAWVPTNSHDFSFLSLSLTLLCAVRWYERPRSWLRAVLLGLAMGLVVAVRIPDIELLVVVPLLGVGSLAAARHRVQLIIGNWSRVVVSIACAVLPFIPQFFAWWYATGHLFARPYPGETFDFLHPHMLEALLWFKPHGLLPYYPVLGIALLGLIWMWFRRRDLALPVTVAFVGFWYVVASWHDWSYTDAFGDRGFIDSVPLLAIPLAFCFSALRRTWMRRSLYAVAGVLVAVTCVLMITYYQRRLPESGIDPGGYLQLLVHPAGCSRVPSCRRGCRAVAWPSPAGRTHAPVLS